METKTTAVFSKQFLGNLKVLKNKLRYPLPPDDVFLKCEVCSLKLFLTSSGILEIESILDKHIGTAIDEMLQNLAKSHPKEGIKCSEKLQLTQEEIPDNIIITLPASEKAYIKDIKICEETYKAKLLVVEETSDKAICVLYQKETLDSTTYFDFFECNFITFLDVDDVERETFVDEEKIHDDETFNLYQHDLERMTGGGRSLSSKYSYECQWCPQHVLKFGQTGKFKEFRSYKKHFNNFHHLQEGIPKSEFDKQVERSDPKWFCRVCKNSYSLGNAVRHRAACWPNDIGSENDSDTEDDIPGKLKARQRKTYKGQNFFGDEDSSSSSEEETEEKKQRKEKQSKTSDNSKEEEDREPIPGPSNQNEHANKIYQSKGKDSNQPSSEKKRVNLDESVSSSDDEYKKGKRKSLKRSKINTGPEIIELQDEFCSMSSPENNAKDADIEPKVEQSENLEIEIEIPSLAKNREVTDKWWQKIEKHLYTDRGLNGPKIFLHGDSEAFVKNCTERYKNHKLKKQALDEKMVEAESAEARLLQFSEERDKSILDKYTSFVQKSSAKDVLKLFSEEYEQLDKEKEVKSSTSAQYSNRILELFRFMANLYHNFHLDWMLDFKGSIEKTQKDGSKTNDIFVPSKDDLTEFIRKYKYGSNPAANCGLRIFAVKKLLEFLSQEIKDNEQAFVGSMLEKRSLVESLVQRIRNLNEGICPDGTIKHLATASNKSHKRSLLEQMAKCPERNMTSIMNGVSDYVNSEEYAYEKTLLIELACKKTKVPTKKEYMNSTNWLLEQLICIGGNRPCALLGITLRDWQERKPGYCPFFQNEGNEMVEDDPDHDSRHVLKNPFIKPNGVEDSFPTGVIVNSETDKIAVGQPCYIWFPNELVDLVNDHSLLAQKYLPKSVDLYHPQTRLFLNSQGKAIARIQCTHFKKYIGLPITSYDFRRSLSTFCLDSKDVSVRNAESSVLRHREETGFAYYYQKHGERVEYVNIQYALKLGLIKADTESVDKYCQELRTMAKQEEHDLSEKRASKILEYGQELLKKRKESLSDARQKGGRNWILPKEYDSFIEGIEEAIRMEEARKHNGPGPFANLLNYKAGTEGAGIFPPIDIWQIDMYRVLYGLGGEKGDLMRAAELSVYDGIPFSEGLSGRKKIAQTQKQEKENCRKNVSGPDVIVAHYWREKIKREARQLYEGKWLPLRFVFTRKELDYSNEMIQKSVKKEKNYDTVAAAGDE